MVKVLNDTIIHNIEVKILTKYISIKEVKQKIREQRFQ